MQAWQRSQLKKNLSRGAVQVRCLGQRSLGRLRRQKHQACILTVCVAAAFASALGRRVLVGCAGREPRRPGCQQVASLMQARQTSSLAWVRPHGRCRWRAKAERDADARYQCEKAKQEEDAGRRWAAPACCKRLVPRISWSRNRCEKIVAKKCLAVREAALSQGGANRQQPAHASPLRISSFWLRAAVRACAADPAWLLRGRACPKSPWLPALWRDRGACRPCAK